MTWFKIDDSFYDHPKVFDAPDCAVALWVRAGAWSARNLTDGFVPAGLPARLCDDPETAVKELVRRGLWVRISGGFRFHDWADFNPSGESVTTLRAKRAEAGRKGGQAKAANQKAKQTSSKDVASASDVAKQTSTPSRPGPLSTYGGGQPHGGTGARDEPPSRCSKHIDNPTDGPCGPCGDARRAHQRWERDRQQRQAAIAAGPHCPRHRGQPADNCSPCRSELLAVDDEQPPRAPARSHVAGLAGGPRCDKHRYQPRDTCVHCHPGRP